MTPVQYATNVVEPARARARELCTKLLHELQTWMCAQPLEVPTPSSVLEVIRHLRDGLMELHTARVPTIPTKCGSDLVNLHTEAMVECQKYENAWTRYEHMKSPTPERTH